VGGLLTAHMFIGLILIPPLLVKIGSTGYRMVRYYANTPEYRRKGAPLLPLRLLAPVLVVATVGIFASGVALMASGHKSDLLLNVHKVSFIVWGVVFVVHFLSYLPRVLRAVGQTASGQGRKVPGAELRAMLLAAGVGSGVALALILLPVITGWSE
jgi:hypothetical protein